VQYLVKGLHVVDLCIYHLTDDLLLYLSAAAAEETLVPHLPAVATLVSSCNGCIQQRSAPFWLFPGLQRSYRDVA